MKKSLSIFTMLYLCVCNGFAQTDTLFVNQSGVIVPKSEAQFYRVASPTEAGVFTFHEYGLDHKLKKVFHATSIRVTLLQGAYTEYDEKGNVMILGTYDKGYKSGEWNYFFHSSKIKKEKQVYNSLHEYYSWQYDSTTRKLESEGGIDKFGKRTGVWKQYHFNSDSVKTISNFLIGKKEGIQLEYYKNGKIKRKELYQNNMLQKGELFDEAGKKIKYYPAFTYPQYRDYVSNYLRKTEPCTAEALKKNDFKVRFVVTKDGDVTEVEVMNVEQDACAQKIKAALLRMKKWKPALWENSPVKYTYETTIRLYVPRD